MSDDAAQRTSLAAESQVHDCFSAAMVSLQGE
jgi:hypothetical protein